MAHQLERAIERRRLLQLFAVTIASITIALYVVSLARHADNARTQWGDTVKVLVASSALSNGDLISASNTHLARVPSTLAVQGALRGNNEGVRITRAVGVNAILTALDVAAESANVPAGWRIVAFPTDLVTPELHSGDRVDVVALGVTIAHDAIVVSSSTQDRGAEIAVPLGVAATVAGAAANGDASLVSAS